MEKKAALSLWPWNFGGLIAPWRDRATVTWTSLMVSDHSVRHCYLLRPNARLNQSNHVWWDNISAQGDTRCSLNEARHCSSPKRRILKKNPADVQDCPKPYTAVDRTGCWLECWQVGESARWKELNSLLELTWQNTTIEGKSLLHYICYEACSYMLLFHSIGLSECCM